MTPETAKLLALLGLIVTSLMAAVTALFAWAKKMAEDRAKSLEEQNEELQKRLDEKDDELTAERKSRLTDAKDYAEGMTTLVHRFRETLHMGLREGRRR